MKHYLFNVSLHEMLSPWAGCARIGCRLITEIIYSAFSASPASHYPMALCTSDNTFQWVLLYSMATAFPAELQYFLHLLKFLMGYDGFVHILYYNPVLFLVRKGFLDIDGSFGTLMPNCCASVFVLMQDTQHRMISAY